MARKEINIGIEGNDGTGDSIRDSFSKVNENFREIYSVLGLGSALSLIGLDDVEPDRNPKQYLTSDNNKVLVVDGTNEKIVFTELVGDDTIVINQSVPGVISFSSLASALINDSQPTLASDLNANFKRLTRLAEGQTDTDAVTKGYTDGKLDTRGVDATDQNGDIQPNWGTMTGPLILSRNPIETDDVNYGGRIAATKAYVDSKTYASINNLYVAPNGQDYRTDIPESLIGRSPATAFKTVQRACEVAEDVLNASLYELGPYQKTLTYNNGTEICTLYDTPVASPLSGTGATADVQMQLDTTQILTIDSGAIINGGTGYEIGDEVSISGGIAIQSAVLRVIAKDFAGSITQLAIITPGVYSELPTDITNMNIVGGSGSGTAVISAVWAVARLVVTASGTNYGAASVIFSGGGGGLGAEAKVTEIGGEIKEINVVRNGVGYTTIPTADIYLPRMLLVTDNLGTDFEDDLREGQLLRGVDSNAVARIISHDAARDQNGNEIFEVDIIQGSFISGEAIQYGDPAQVQQITIQVETGIYYEHFPLRLSPNISLRGDEFRRTIIRPLKGTSQSRWARTFFRRDPVIDGLRVTPYEYGYHYLTDPLDFSSTPKNNDEMDVFLCADATLIRNISVQGHGGFMMVLDPNSQINSKSPYCQTGSSFSKSIDAKIFAGGQFVDGFSGNLDGILLRRVPVDPSDPNYVVGNPLTHEDANKVVIGGILREPQLPTSFLVNGDLYRITLANRLESEYFDAKVLLEANRTFIQTETVAWINAQFPTLDYDEDKCFRDVGLIVDSVVNDVLFGGFIESTQAGRLYFSGGATVVSGQVTETAAAIGKAGEIAIAVLRQEEWPRIGTVSQTLIQSIVNAEANGAQQKVQSCFDIIENIVATGEVLYKTKNVIQLNKEFLQAETIKYLDVNYPSLDYDRATCKRDAGYIIDAISIDIFGDYNNSLRAGYSYFRAGQSLIPADQINPTVDAVEFIRLRIKELIDPSATVNASQTVTSFDPSTTIDVASNIITFPNGHPFTSGSRVKYNNGGNTSIGILGEVAQTLTNNGVYYVFALDGARIKLYTSLDLVIAQEKDPLATYEVDFSTAVSSGTHTLSFDVFKDTSVTTAQVNASGAPTGVDTGLGYVKTLIAGGDSTTIPEIYPQYECVLDNAYNEMVGGKITLTTPGNKSMLGNDFTQVNDMGYGIFATNNGLIESVSIFTYYCYNAFYSLNGAQIRSLNGSSSHGYYGLRAEGADPNEIPDRVTLKFPLIQTARIYEDRPNGKTNDIGETTIYLQDWQYPPRSGSILEIDHTGDTLIAGGLSKVGQRTYTLSVVKEVTGLPGVYECGLEIQASGQGALQADVPNFKDVILRLNEELVLTDKEDIVATRPSTALIFDESRGMENTTIRVLSFTQYNEVDAQPFDVTVTSRDGFPYVLLPIREEDVQDPSYVKPDYCNLAGDDAIAVQSLSFDDRQRILTQLTGFTVYDGSTTGTGGMLFGYMDSIYEITGYTTEDIIVGGNAVDNFGIITFKNVKNPTAIGRTIDINSATQTNPVRITTPTAHKLRQGRKIQFGVDNPVVGMAELNGNSYYINIIDSTTFDLYLDEDLTQPVDGTGFGSFTNGNDSIELIGGLTYPVEGRTDEVLLAAGLRASAPGDVTVNISTMRATGHDFLDVGTGSYADTNYPSNIFGPPTNSANQEREVIESGKGRVFFVSTDQSGNFRVGDFFAVDQGTGKLSIDAKIDLKGIDSLKLRSGAEIFEFSNDITMGGTGPADPQACPTENSVRNYIDLRLGLLHSGGVTSTGLIGPGFLPLNGSVAMKGPIDMDDKTVTGLPDPRFGASGDNDAVPKNYMTIGNLQDAPDGWLADEGRSSDYSNIDSADILAFLGDGTSAEFTNATVTGALTFTLNRGTLTAYPDGTDKYTDPQIVATINDNVIVNDDVNYNAGIEQHKLDLNIAKAVQYNGINITNYAWDSGNSLTTVTTQYNHGITEGDAVVISGETGVTALNGDWKAINVGANTFQIIADTSSGGTLSGGLVRHYGVIGGANSLVFTLNNGWLDLKPSTNALAGDGSFADGIPFNTLRYIDVNVPDPTDINNTNAITRVLGRRGNPLTGTADGPPVPIAASTIVEDGDGLSRAEVPSVGAVVRTATGTGPNKFTTVVYGSGSTANTIVQRDGDGGASFGGTLSVGAISTSDDITLNAGLTGGDLAGSEASQNGYKITVGTSTATVISRIKSILDNTDSNAYYSVFRDGAGNPTIQSYYGNNDINKKNVYTADRHQFRSTASTYGTIDVGNNGLITTGNETTPGRIQGVWTLEGTGSRFAATWADLAEWYSSDTEYEPGTVVMFGGEAEVTKSNKQGTTKVAGVVTTAPAFVMNEKCEGTRVCIALQGRVPCKVVGTIKKGDLMITSSIPGVAVSAGETASAGTIIGKALEDFDSERIGTIEVAVGRL